MDRDDWSRRAFAPLDALIDEAEQRDAEFPWPGAGADEIGQAEKDSISRALDEFFYAPPDREGRPHGEGLP